MPIQYFLSSSLVMMTPVMIPSFGNIVLWKIFQSDRLMIGNDMKGPLFGFIMTVIAPNCFLALKISFSTEYCKIDDR